MRRSSVGLWVVLAVLLSFSSVVRSDSCDVSGSARVKETEIDSPVSSIEWIRPPGGISGSTEAIFVISTNGTLYRSRDEGRTWSFQLSQVKAMALTNDTNKQWVYNPDTGKLWNTNNQGLSYNTVASHHHFTFVQGHPTIPNTALAIAREGQTKNLFVTRNFGATWQHVHQNVEQASWGQAGEDGVPEGTMFALVRMSGANSTFMHTKDYFHTIDYSLSRALVFLYHKKAIFVARNSHSRGLELWSSVDGGEVFTRAIFPKKAETPERRYTIADFGEGSAFVNVELSSTQYGSTYGSDSLEREFSEVLKYNRRTSDGRVDFRRIFGLEGIYIANRYTSPAADMAQTVITYNRGADWATLKAPAKDFDGNSIACGVNCSLHLMGRTDSSKFNQLYSNENAVGLIIANGNVGQSLADTDAITGPYISRDAGQTWLQIGKGSHVFEIANHGAILLFAEDSRPTTDLKYSWTQGLTQVSCSFTRQPMQVTEIATEPDNKARTFLMYGTRGSKGVLVHVDFGGAVRECGEDDFENWSPLGDQNKCLLGVRYTYQRRKQDRVCIVDRDHQPITKTEICPCVEEDYECDFCYEPTGARPTLCKKICDDFDPKQEPPECIDSWYETQGYRLVAGNKCDRSSDVAKALEPIKHACGVIPDNGTAPDGQPKSGKLSGGSVFGIIVVIGFIMFGGLAVATFILTLTNQQFREMSARYMPQRLLDLLGTPSGRYDTAGQPPPRSGGGYAKVGASGASSLLDDLDQGGTALGEEEDVGQESSFTSTSSSAPKGFSNKGGDDEDDFNPRV